MPSATMLKVIDRDDWPLGDIISKGYLGPWDELSLTIYASPLNENPFSELTRFLLPSDTFNEQARPQALDQASSYST